MPSVRSTELFGRPDSLPFTRIWKSLESKVGDLLAASIGENECDRARRRSCPFAMLSGGIGMVVFIVEPLGGGNRGVHVPDIALGLLPAQSKGISSFPSAVPGGVAGV